MRTYVRKQLEKYGKNSNEFFNVSFDMKRIKYSVHKEIAEEKK